LTNIGEKDIIEMSSQIEQLNERLQDLLRYQMNSEMSDDFYYSSGKKAKDDADIQLVRNKIKELKDKVA
jgi:hypothetical protein